MNIKLDLQDIINMISQFNIMYKVGVPTEKSQKNRYYEYLPIKDALGRTYFTYMITQKGVVMFIRKSTYKNLGEEIPQYLRLTKFRNANNSNSFQKRFLITNTLPATRSLLNSIYRECQKQSDTFMARTPTQLDSRLVQKELKEIITQERAQRSKRGSE